jgi:hypothetical protein
MEVGAPRVAALGVRIFGYLPGRIRARLLQGAFDRARDAFNRGDLEVVFALFADDVEYGPPPPLYRGEWLQGRAAVFDFWHAVFAKYDSTIENLTLEEAAPGRVVRTARLTHRPKNGGETLSYVIRQTTELIGGRVVLQVNVVDSD